MLAILALALTAFSSSASADTVISQPGEGAGQTDGPTGLAVNFETGRLYVADRDNRRVDVFGPDGTFEKAFGWGVKNGESEFQICTTSCRKGLGGNGNGQFSDTVETETLRAMGGPTSVAVDNSCFLHDPPLTGAACEAFNPSNGSLYVADPAALRVQKFDAEGNFILTFGGGVNKTVPGNVCTKASGHTCGVGANEFVEGAFSAMGKLFVGVGPDGVVYVIDDHVKEEAQRKFRLQKFEPSGVQISPEHILSPEGERSAALAVDSTGDFYAASEAGSNEAIRKYDSDGNLLGVIANATVFGLAINAADHLFLATNTEDGKPVNGRQSIVEYDPSGTPLRRFGYGSFKANIHGLAPHNSATGDIYGSETDSNRVLQVNLPQPGPLILPEPCKPSFLGNAKATLFAQLNPEGKATTYHFEFITEKDFDDNGGSFEGADPATATPESASIGSDTIIHAASADVEVAPETEYRCRVVASNADAAAVIGPEGTFTSKPPLEIGESFVTDVGAETASLNAEVNPFGILASGYFEYVEEATYQKDIAELGPEHGFDHATKTPDVDAAEEPIDFGASESFKVGSAQLAGLKPATAYRFRIVATDVKIAPEGKEVVGSAESFRTLGPPTDSLPDLRAYELVSPAEKNSADVGAGAPTAGATSYSTYRLIQAGADSGEAITYTSWTSFGAPKSAPGSSQYLSKRDAAGWETENISPPLPGPRFLIPPFRGFSADLRWGGLVTRPPGGSLLVEDIYLRDMQSGAMQTLSTEAPQVAPKIEEVCMAYAGASEDGTRAFFASNASYAGAPLPLGDPESVSLYEWSAGEGLRVISVLPGKSAPVAPTANTSFGPPGLPCQSGEKLTRHVVSADGSRVFWTYVPSANKKEMEEGKKPPTQLLVRIGGEETVQLDKRVGGPDPTSGDGLFMGASADGSKAFFTDQNRLVLGASKGDLYRYELPGKTLTDLTPGLEAADVQGVAGISDDGSYVYFVAGGVLSGGEENDAGQKAEAGENNLYLHHDGQITFIAQLHDVDSSDWTSVPRVLSARVTPDGRHLAFLSLEAQKLAGYDNRIASGIHCQLSPFKGDPLQGSALCPQAFLYDADANTLTCASCNPTNARPSGPSRLPGWSNPLEGPRYLSDDGQRLFFESFDALVSRDENGTRDVYEFERAGTGTCTAESPALVASGEGCVFLISGGQSTDESYLLDASSSGRDVFLSTRAPLLGRDPNEQYDVYDVREGGGFPEPEARPSCEGEACKQVPIAPPIALPAPASASFEGPGNESRPRPRCAKGQVRRKSRCVKPARHGKPGHRKGKAQRKGRAAR